MCCSMLYWVHQSGLPLGLEEPAVIGLRLITSKEAWYASLRISRLELGVSEPRSPLVPSNRKPPQGNPLSCFVPVGPLAAPRAAERVALVA